MQLGPNLFHVGPRLHIPKMDAYIYSYAKEVEKMKQKMGNPFQSMG